MVDAFDSMYGDEFDLCDEVIMKGLLNKLAAKYYHAFMAMPPCSTFGCRRDDGGPPPLRTAEGPELYGKKGLKPEDAEKVKVGNLCAINAAAAAEAAMSSDTPWLLEQPWPQPDRAHMTRFSEWQRLVQLDGVKSKKIAQCALEADYCKPTLLMGTIATDYVENCKHEKQWLREVPSGRWIFAAHPPLRGKLKAVKSSEWTEELRSRRPTSQDEFLTRSAAAYPSEMNRVLARDLIKAALDAAKSRMSAGLPQTPGFSNPEGEEAQGHSTMGPGTDRKRKAEGPQAMQQRIVFEKPLKGKPPQEGSARETADDVCIGGLRAAHKALGKIPGLRKAGEVVRKVLTKLLLKDPALFKRCVSSIGSEEELSLIHI